MAQIEIEVPDNSASEKIYQLVNSEAYAVDTRKAKAGNKAAKRRLRNMMLSIQKFAKEGRKELLSGE